MSSYDGSFVTLRESTQARASSVHGRPGNVTHCPSYREEETKRRRTAYTWQLLSLLFEGCFFLFCLVNLIPFRLISWEA
jgi:hypothetical protein